MVMADDFTPFFGVVESVDDPKKVGRVRVRVHGFHSPNQARIPTDYLQWFSCVVNNSTALLGRGSSPTGYEVGTHVFGYFLEKTMQTGIVIGALSGYTNGTNDVSGLARGEDHQMHDLKEQNRIQSIRGPLRKGEWSEPPYTNKAQYPLNNVYESHNGHVKEYDDTSGGERIHEYHRSGTYYEIDASGNKTVKVVGDGYEIVAGKKNVAILGDVNITVSGNVNWYIGGDMNVQVDGNKTEVVQGSVKEYYSGSQTTFSNGGIGIDGSKIDLNSGEASGNAGIPITLPTEFDLEFATPVIKSAGRYAALDEPSEIKSTPDEYPEDTKPNDYDGEAKEEAEVEEQEKPTPELGDCMNIELPINYNTNLSPNFTIASLSTNALFDHTIRSQVGLTEQEIVCNLEKLALNILEPLKEEWGSFRINSGFRVGSGGSQHNRGMAVDIQEPSWSNSKHLEVAKWMADNLPCDQLIFEHGNSVWIHVSFDRNKIAQRGQLLTMLNGNYESGLKLYYA